MEERSCKERLSEHLRSRIEDLEKLWTLYCEGNEEGDPELGTFEEYGLSFDYVPPGTFDGQRKGYFRYQLSWGGPQEEFRFLTENPNDPEPVIEFWLLDWFDGAGRKLTGKNYALMREIWNFFRETGTTQAAFEKSQE